MEGRSTLLFVSWMSSAFDLVQYLMAESLKVMKNFVGIYLFVFLFAAFFGYTFGRCFYEGFLDTNKSIYRKQWLNWQLRVCYTGLDTKELG